jgi:hypothetical protein
VIELLSDERTYDVDGRKMPRVTTILGDLRLIYRVDDEAAKIRGTAVHKAIAFLLEERLDWKSVDPLILGFIKAAQKFCADMDVHPIAIEQHVAIPELGYAGTLDLLCTFGRSKAKAVVDWSTGAIPVTKGLQMIGYAAARPIGTKPPKQPLPPIGRVGVELREDGTYITKIFDVKYWYADWRAWLGAIALWQWVTRVKARPQGGVQ